MATTQDLDTNNVTWVLVTCGTLTQTYAVHDGELVADWFVRKADAVTGLNGETVRLVRGIRKSHFKVLKSVS